ncbi:PREDICTED: uncharacterized protein LOC105135016 [Populus euphratica]|uniref:Uncharacterized protein LOC105135016 n=1 Tax=Populus euphratica TaxID=75702 RepID=A0AAJ6Y0V6_POPEU|nr:PREDICTED: uncharacterized protein LOC105135016 [Populus euphratica]
MTDPSYPRENRRVVYVHPNLQWACFKHCLKEKTFAGPDSSNSLASSVSPALPSSASNFATSTAGSRSWPDYVLGSSSTSPPIVSPPGLNLCVDLSQFSLQRVSASVSSIPPRVTLTHFMVLRPRKSQTVNVSVSSALQVASLPQQELFTFKDANKYLTWHKAMKEEIQALHYNNTWNSVPFHSFMNVVGSVQFIKLKGTHVVVLRDIKAWLIARGFI